MLLSLAVGSACGGPAKLTLRPVLQIKHGYYLGAGDGCHGNADSPDLKTGLAVTLYGPSGSIVGTGFVTRSTTVGGDCYLIATVTNAAPESFYDVQFGDGNKIAFSRAEIQNGQADTQVPAP